MFVLSEQQRAIFDTATLRAPSVAPRARSTRPSPDSEGARRGRFSFKRPDRSGRLWTAEDLGRGPRRVLACEFVRYYVVPTARS